LGRVSASEQADRRYFATPGGDVVAPVARMQGAGYPILETDVWEKQVNYRTVSWIRVKQAGETIDPQSILEINATVI
jgi:hypothetical protein